MLRTLLLCALLLGGALVIAPTTAADIPPVHELVGPDPPSHPCRPHCHMDDLPFRVP